MSSARLVQHLDVQVRQGLRVSPPARRKHTKLMKTKNKEIHKPACVPARRIQTKLVKY